MRYSVYNIGTRMFDYYDTPQPATTSNVPKPAHLKPRTLGATVEQACWPLPADARLAGSGPSAQGQVAITAGAALGASEGAAGGDLGVAKGLLLAAAGALAVKYLLPRGRR